MKNYSGLVLILALTAWTLPVEPCRAQAGTSDIPVLGRFDGRDWIYFAPPGDGTLNFKNPPQEGSNAWVAAERAESNRRILSKVPMWKDNRGRLHTVGVLKVQMEFNDYVRAARISDPTAGFSYEVAETGILDVQTLAIPYMKLSVRILKINARLVDESDAINRLHKTDPSAAALRDKFLSYMAEKNEDAVKLLNELNELIFDLPQSQPGQGFTGFSSPGNFTGLRDLALPTASQDGLRLESRTEGESRFSRASGRTNPEDSNADFIDTSQMTRAMFARLLTKEAAVERAAAFSESLCKDMLTPPCK